MAEHAFDSQSAAFRNAGPADWVSDEQRKQMFAEDLLLDTTEAPVRLPEQFEAEGWDAGRHPSGPKTVEEAREALRERVDSPIAPDRDYTLYDNLDDV